MHIWYTTNHLKGQGRVYSVLVWQSPIPLQMRYLALSLADSDHLEEDLAELTGEISIKQRMIEELEKSQRQLQSIRQHYEEKLRNLQDQIGSVERERDQVLNSLGMSASVWVILAFILMLMR